jgi:ComF family protein
VRSLWEASLNLLYPPFCCGCGERAPHPGFCDRCRARITTPQSPLCDVCGIPFAAADGADHRCGRCLVRRPAFRRARAGAVYDAADSANDPLKSVLQRYKYDRDLGLARPLAALLQERCPLVAGDVDVIVPVPLHLDRLRWRGFNQAQYLARRLARAAGVPVDALALRRIRPTLPQVHLDEAARRGNVAGAFRVVRPERVAGRRLLLLDDVYTTGATVNECSRALLRAGARRVDVLVLARAVLH